jgi:hypothetical protein
VAAGTTETAPAGADRHGSAPVTQSDRLGPSIAVGPAGAWLIAFHANTGVLWTRTSSTTGGHCHVSFQGADGTLSWVFASGQVVSLGMRMSPGASPATAPRPGGGFSEYLRLGMPL